MSTRHLFFITELKNFKLQFMGLLTICLLIQKPWFVTLILLTSFICFDIINYILKRKTKGHNFIMVNEISFPRLGINLKLSTVAFSIGSKPIYWYALIILTGFILAVVFCCAGAKKRNIKPDNLIDIGLYGLIFGLLGARLYYVLLTWSLLQVIFGAFLKSGKADLLYTAVWSAL